MRCLLIMNMSMHSRFLWIHGQSIISWTIMAFSRLRPMNMHSKLMHMHMNSWNSLACMHNLKAYVHTYSGWKCMFILIVQIHSAKVSKFIGICFKFMRKHVHRENYCANNHILQISMHVWASSKFICSHVYSSKSCNCEVHTLMYAHPENTCMSILIIHLNAC